MSTDSEVRILRQRAQDSLRAAEVLVDIDPNSSASRAFYAAFQAVSALFLLEGRHFRKHSETRAAVHRDLVHAGRFDVNLGKAYDLLNAQRDVGDYSSAWQVTRDEAEQCVEAARQIVDAVNQLLPEDSDPSD